MKKLFLGLLIFCLLASTAYAGVTRYDEGIGTRGKTGALGELKIPAVQDYVVFFDDFNIAPTTNSFGIEKYVQTVSTDDASIAVGDSRNGLLVMTGSASEACSLNINSEDETILLEPSSTSSGNVFYECRFKTSNVTSPNILIGLTVRDTSPFDALTDGVFLRKERGGVTASVVAVMDSSLDSDTGEVSLGTLAVDTYYTVGWHYKNAASSLNQTIDVYLNDVFKGTISYDAVSLNIPTNELLLHNVHFGHYDNAADTLTIDYIYSATER